jgi:hypothetical protein
MMTFVILHIVSSDPRLSAPLLLCWRNVPSLFRCLTGRLCDGNSPPAFSAREENPTGKTRRAEGGSLSAGRLPLPYLACDRLQDRIEVKDRCRPSER